MRSSERQRLGVLHWWDERHLLGGFRKCGYRMDEQKSFAHQDVHLWGAHCVRCGH